MKLLLDEMYPARLAQALREEGVDAAGVDQRPPLRGLADAELLLIAAHEQRALVSENVADFMRLYGEWGEQGRTHAGIVIALATRFSRRRAAHGHIVAALADLCAQRPAVDALANEVHFLAPPRSASAE